MPIAFCHENATLSCQQVMPSADMCCDCKARDTPLMHKPVNFQIHQFENTDNSKPNFKNTAHQHFH